MSAARTRSRALLVDAGIDRDAAFRKARRHTALVRMLRVAFPVSAVLMLLSYVVLMQRTLSFSWGDKKVTADAISISRESLVAYNPRYTGFDKGGAEYEVRAATAEQDLTLKGIVKMRDIDGRLIDASRQTTTLKSPRGTLDTNTSVLELYDRIDVASQNGMTAQLTRATVLNKENRIISDQPVTVRMPTGTIHGKTMLIEQRQKQVLFAGGVVANLKGQPRPQAAAQQPAEQALRGSQGQPGLAARSDAPVDITSERLLVDDAAKTATFSGNVVARQTDSVMETAEMEVHYEGNQTGAGAGPAPAAGTDGNGRLKRIMARRDVVLTRGIEKATGSSGEFDAVTDRAVLLGPVVISGGPDRGATADRADIDNRNDIIRLTGNVVVTQQKNVLKGRLLIADRKNNTMQMSSPAMVGLARGQISAKLYQADNDNAAQGAKKQQTPGQPPAKGATGSLLGGAGPRSDPSQPIDVDADMLDVDDRKKTAIFRGKVKALQGEYTILTEELIATYTGEGGMALTPPGAGSSQPASAQAAAQPKSGAQLQEIRAPRKIDILAKDGQRAQGNSAVFNPKTNTATLTGNVTLVQGSSVTAGTCAHLDMTTGLMKIPEACTGGAAGTASAPGGTRPQRAQVLIYPNQLREEQKTGGGGALPPPALPPQALPAEKKLPLKPPLPPKVEDAKSTLF